MRNVGRKEILQLRAALRRRKFPNPKQSSLDNVESFVDHLELIQLHGGTLRRVSRSIDGERKLLTLALTTCS